MVKSYRHLRDLQLSSAIFVCRDTFSTSNILQIAPQQNSGVKHDMQAEHVRFYLGPLYARLSQRVYNVVHVHVQYFRKKRTVHVQYFRKYESTFVRKYIPSYFTLYSKYLRTKVLSYFRTTVGLQRVHVRVVCVSDYKKTEL